MPTCVCLHFSWPLFPSSTFMMVSNLPATYLTERKDISKFMNMICACATRDRLFYSHRRFLYAHTKSYGSLFILKFLPSLNNYCRLIFYCNIAWGETHCNYSDLGVLGVICYQFDCYTRTATPLNAIELKCYNLVCY